ncbi:hypothetical protein AB0D60_07900 [Streptomyces sp. NPDC048306]|uniref:hypothetical protein n=1 Tax=Streptomyces sp. NPDC048306 TaxID=3154502 RepID=UPI0034076E44
MCLPEVDLMRRVSFGDLQPVPVDPGEHADKDIGVDDVGSRPGQSLRRVIKLWCNVQ